MEAKDLTGQKFGRLIVLKRDFSHKKDGCIYWLCKCECGKERVINRASLISGNTRSCGCLQKECAQKYVDLTGQTFGRLTVIEKCIERTSFGHILWLCKCSCGNIKKISGQSLKSEYTQSCGCLQKETASKRTLPDYISGKNKLYKQYINKAKKKEKLFELSFDDFVIMTQQNCYYCGSKPISECRCKPNSIPYLYNGIDRIDNMKGYSKDNCVTCCPTCNYAKRSMSYEQFIKWVESVYFNLITKEQRRTNGNESYKTTGY